MKKKDRKLKEFVDNHLDLIALKYDVSKNLDIAAYIMYDTPLGDITYYPKSDRIQVHLDNKWISDGLKYIHDFFGID